MIELREERPDDAQSRAFWEEYQALLRERLGPGFAPSEEIFAADSAFDGPGGAWLVAYEDGVPVACGGLRPLDATTAEVKRMFVTGPARRRGIGRLLLAELEARAAAAGMCRVRVLTTAVLVEARALYAGHGYRVVCERDVAGRRDLWLERELG